MNEFGLHGERGRKGQDRGGVYSNGGRGKRGGGKVIAERKG